MRRPLALLLVLAAVSCHRDMRDSGRVKPLEGSSVFADGRSARAPVAGTVARGQLRADAVFHTGKKDGLPVAEIPLALTREALERGRERYNIFCSPCHDRTGGGRGMVVQRGFQQPVSFHEQRLREAPDGQLFDAITSGYGVMYGFASRIPAEDRWRIVAYIRVLQYSQHAPASDVPAEALARLDNPPPAQGQTEEGH